MRRMIYLTIAVLLVAAGVTWLEEKPLATKIRVKTPEKLTVQPEAQEVPPLKRKPAEDVPLILDKELEELRDLLPVQSDLNREARENPHQTPPSLLAFAGKLGELMDQALANPADKELLLRELEDCALDDKAATSARALCLSNAEKLGDRALRKVVPKEIKNLVDRKRLLLRSSP